MKIITHPLLTIFKRILIVLLIFSSIWLILCQYHFYNHHDVEINIVYDQPTIEYQPAATGHRQTEQIFVSSSSDQIQITRSEKRSLQIAQEQRIMENEDIVNIILCSDTKDRLPMYTLINSIIQNERYIERLSFHILVLENIPLFFDEFTRFFSKYFDKISFEFKSIIEDIPECIEYSDIASTTLPDKQKRNWLNNVMNFARFCAPNAFKNVDVAIYLDVDMIVQNGISKLYDNYYNIYKKEGIFAWSVMNRSPYKKTFRSQTKSEFINNYLNYNLSNIYHSVASKPINFSKINHIFNAGILMFNFDFWRKNNLTQQSLELFKFNNIFKSKFHKRSWTGVTQPIFNMIFIINNIKIGDFGQKWNYVLKDNPLLRSKKCTKKLSKITKRTLSKQNILHFAGGCKPWTIGSKLNTMYLWLRYIPENALISDWEHQFNITLI